MTHWRDAMHLVTFGLALVLAAAAVLFVLVGLNPKDSSYGNIPWIYSAASLVGGIFCWWLSRRFAKQPGNDAQQPVSHTSEK